MTSLTQLCSCLGGFLGPVQHDFPQGRHGSRCPRAFKRRSNRKMIEFVILMKGRSWNMPKLSKGPIGLILTLRGISNSRKYINTQGFQDLELQVPAKLLAFLRLCASFSLSLQRSDHSDKSTLPPNNGCTWVWIFRNVQILHIIYIIVMYIYIIILYNSYIYITII